MNSELRSIAGYEIEGKISAGGMGTVYRASRRGSHGFSKRVAIKIIHDEFLNQPEVQALFTDEARLAARLSHPNICQVFDFGVERDTYYLVMEYVPGFSLVDIMRAQRARGALPPPHLVARVIADAARGLHHAHELRSERGALLNVVHRDVSPENIRVTPDGNVKVLDFGIARWAERVTVTRQSVVRGKAAYMSPEQVRGDPLDRRADVFALGVVMYELFTCRPLFPRDDFAETMLAVEQMPIPDLRDCAPDVPAELVAIVSQALERDPARRFATAEQMTIAVEHVVTRLGLPASAEALAHHLQTLGIGALAIETESAAGLLAPAAAVGDAYPSRISTVDTTAPAALPVQAGLRHHTEVLPEDALRAARAVDPNALTDPLPADAGPTAPLDGRRARWHRPGVWIALGAVAGLATVALIARLAIHQSQATPMPAVAHGDAAIAHGGGRDAAIATATTTAIEPAAADAGANDGAIARPRADRSKSRPRLRPGGGATSAPAAGRGTISVFAHPWANVRIDGVPVGPTPLRNYLVSAGSHTIEVVAPDTNRVREAREVSVTAGGHQDVTVRDR